VHRRDDAAGVRVWRAVEFAPFTSDATVKGLAIGRFGTGVSGMNDVIVEQNLIGLTAQGAPLPNGTGLALHGNGARASYNTIGHSLGAALRVEGNRAFVDSNWVGVRWDDVTAVPNGEGIRISGQDNDVAANTVRHNQGNGITVASGTRNLVIGNDVGPTGAWGSIWGMTGRRPTIPATAIRAPTNC
jgi:hypothetical protein